MLTISNNGEQIPLNFDDYYIQEVYGGRDAAGFTLPLDHPGYQYLFEETPLIDTETKTKISYQGDRRGTNHGKH